MSSRFRIEATPIAGLVLVHRQPLADGRGFFERLFCPEELAASGFPGVVAQINRSSTGQAGTVRGLHFQHPPFAEWKHITCLEGSVHDVVVDLRRDSPTFLAAQAVTLSRAGRLSLVVPPGCAHGFQVLEGPAELLYVHSQRYAPEAEAGVRADDPRLGIAWPLPIVGRSPRDAAHPLLAADFAGVLA
jgi:dTDP-4-dehydrorhamnose 3,5-epimerase